MRSRNGHAGAASAGAASRLRSISMRHEFGLDPVQEREVGETRGEIGPIAQEHDLPAGPVVRQHDGEALGGARRLAGVDVFVDQHELALLLERLAVDARRRPRSPRPWRACRRRDRPP